MYGLTRGPVTLIGAGAAGLLIWIATQLNNGHQSGYWGIIGLMAAAGLIMALSQLLGGWTKWGWPRLSPLVFLIGFVPVAIAALWVIFAGEPSGGWFHNHVMAWTRDLHISGLVTDMLKYIPVFAFGAGLVFGFSFDTTGPAIPERDVDRRRDVTDDWDADEPVRSRRRDVVDDDRYADEPAPVERDVDEPVTAERRNVADEDGRPVTRTDDDRVVTTRRSDRT